MFIIVDRSVAIYEFTVYFKIKHCAMKSFEKVTEVKSRKKMCTSCSCPIYGRCLDCSRRAAASVCVLSNATLCHILGVRTRTVDAIFV